MSLPINDKIIDLFFDLGTGGTFKMLRAEETEIYSCNLQLSYGNISKIEERKLESYKAMGFLYGETNSRAYKSGFTKMNVLNILKNTKKKIRIWAGKRASDDICGLYYLCHELIDNNNLYLVDVPIRDDSHLWSQEVDYYMCNDSFGSLHLFDGTKEQMDYYYNFYNSIVYEKISKKDMKKYAKKWEELVSINSNIRLYEDGEIHCYNYSDFYDEILSINNGKTIMAMDCATKYLHEHNSKQLNLYQIEMIIYRMIKETYVKVVGTKKCYPGRDADALIIQKND